MFKLLRKNFKVNSGAKENRRISGQQLTELPVILLIVMAALITMGPYVVRSWNANMKGVEDAIMDSHNDPLIQAPRGIVEIDGCQCNVQEDNAWTIAACGLWPCEETQWARRRLCEPPGCEALLGLNAEQMVSCEYKDECCTSLEITHPKKCGVYASDVLLPAPPAGVGRDTPYYGDIYGCADGYARALQTCGDGNIVLGCVQDSSCNLGCVPPPEPPFYQLDECGNPDPPGPAIGSAGPSSGLPFDPDCEDPPGPCYCSPTEPEGTVYPAPICTTTIGPDTFDDDDPIGLNIVESVHYRLVRRYKTDGVTDGCSDNIPCEYRCDNPNASPILRSTACGYCPMAPENRQPEYAMSQEECLAHNTNYKGFCSIGKCGSGQCEVTVPASCYTRGPIFNYKCGCRFVDEYYLTRYGCGVQAAEQYRRPWCEEQPGCEWRYVGGTPYAEMQAIGVCPTPAEFPPLGGGTRYQCVSSTPTSGFDCCPIFSWNEAACNNYGSATYATCVWE